MSQLIKEAFQELKTLNEDTFSFDKEGILDLSKFLTIDDKISTLDVIDPQATNEEELAPNYLGKVALQCCVCNQLVYADPAEIEVDEETQRVNVGQECPHCYNIGGYKVVGQINPYVDTEETKVTIDGDDVEVEEKEELGESLNEDMTLKDIVEDSYNHFKYDLGREPKFYEVLNDIMNNYTLAADWDEATIGREIENTLHLFDESLNEDTVKQNGKWVNKGKEGTHGTFKTKKAADAQRKAMFAQGYKGESLKEDTNDYNSPYYDMDQYLLKEEDIKFFDEETGDIIVDQKVLDKDIKEEDHVLFEFDDEEVGVQEFKFIRKTEDGYQFEWIGVVPESLNESRPDKDNFHILNSNRMSKLRQKINSKEMTLDQVIDYIEKTWGREEPGSAAYLTDWLKDEYKKEESLNEDFTKATVETGESVLSMESDDSGKVTVTSEPRKIEESGEEMLAPISTEAKAEIKDTNEEESEDVEDLEIPVEDEEQEVEGEEGAQVDMDIEEIEEEGFDELGESYLRKEYDNVKSFKTTRGSIDNDRIKLEGVITFNSGKKAKTSFIFESNSISKKGKLKFLGENLQFAKKKNAFTLIGSVKDNKLMVESLTYNYRAQDTKSGVRKNLYGTVKRSK